MHNDMITSSMGWYPVAGTLSAVENKRQVAPFFTIVAKNAEEILPNLRHQTMQDFNLAQWTDQTGLTDFSCSASQYCLLVMNNRVFNTAIEDKKFLVRVMLNLLRYDIAYARLGFPVAGVVFARKHFVGRDKFIRYGSLVHDLHKFYSSVSSNLALIDLLLPKRKPEDWAEPLGSTACGWRNGPNDPRHTNDTLLSLLSVPPVDVYSAISGKINCLWTCIPNEWYEHGKLLRKCVGLESDLQIPGKLQHGWQTETGLDGEQGYKDEVRINRLPVYIWNSRNLENCKAEGVDHVVPMGAPFIYRSNGNDPGPAENKLLVFPFHSVPEYQIYSDWAKFSVAMLDTAKERGFNGATICLHHFDYQNERVRTEIRASGVDVVCLGDPMARCFMDRLVDLIRYHSAVASDRVCSAGLYSMLLNRPFFVYGEALENPDPIVGLGANRVWLKENMPSVLEFTGKVDKDLAERELGLEFKKSKQELQDLLWGHCL